MYELKTEISPDLVQPLEDFFCEYVRSNWSLFNVRPGEPFFLMAYFEDEAELWESYAEVRAKFKVLPEKPAVQYMDDKEWQEAYKDFIDPWSSRGLHWIPVWMREEYTVPAGEVAVYLDAGMAFGTGSHETTRLMAMRLVDYKLACGEDAFAAKQIIDAGCGSGILALSAAKLGFQNIAAFDCDPEAIRVSRENRAFNELPDAAVEFTEAGLEAGLAGKQCDLMLANIQADVLQIHAEGILQAIAPGGVLGLSGILVIELEQVKQTFSALADTVYGEYTCDSRSDGEWADLCFFRK